MGQTLLLVGLQWGDEGKGKVIDALSGGYEVVVRFQGGANAGHTVHIGEDQFVLHLVPSGILHEHTQCVLGNGMVVDPEGLLEEIEGLRTRGIRVEDNLAVSDRAHVVLPHHKLLDQARETARGSSRLGTTGRGIGPCYADKAARRGIRFAEMLAPGTFHERLEAMVDLHNSVLENVFGADSLEFEEIYDRYCGFADLLRPFVRDTVTLLHEALDEGRNILLEGAQGSLLDLDFGTYPFVTSSGVITGASGGTGIPPNGIDRVIGLAKAYCSRVGTGPFPTEQDNDVGETIRQTMEDHGGREYGATTGRQRRCGWLDGVALAHTAALSGADALAVSALDVLGAFETIKVCTAYRVEGERMTTFPASAAVLELAEPEYEELPGWRCAISDARRWEDLPRAARDYVGFVEDLAGAPVQFISVGPNRQQMIERTADD